MAEKGEPVGVDGLGTAVAEERTAEVLKVGPGGVRGNKGGGDVLAGVVVDGEQEGLLGVGLPPGVDGGVMLPELPDAGPLPAAAGLGDGGGRLDQAREVGADVGGDGLPIAQEAAPAEEFIGEELEVGWALKGQEVLQQASDLRRPWGSVVAAGNGRGGLLVDPAEAKAEEVGPADVQTETGLGRIDQAVVEVVEGEVDEVGGEPAADLALVFKATSRPAAVSGARPFVGLRYAPASSSPRPGHHPKLESPFVPPTQSPFVPTPTGRGDKAVGPRRRAGHAS